MSFASSHSQFFSIIRLIVTLWLHKMYSILQVMTRATLAADCSLTVSKC